MPYHAVCVGLRKVEKVDGGLGGTEIRNSE